MRKHLARLKRKLLAKPYLKDKRYPAFWFDQLLGKKSAFLVQIGSNDGKTNDPLYSLFQKNKAWKALLVEPIPHFFSKLQQNYPDSTRFQLENVAINEGKQLPFYWVAVKAKEKFPDLPFWYEQLGSFEREHITRELGDKIEPFIISKNLEGITLVDLWKRNKIKQIDILHIDAEGYDWKILSQLNLEEFTPKFILFEYHHLPENELEAAKNFLKSHYFLLHAGIDILAVNRHIDTSLLDQMKQYMKEI